MAKTHRKKKDVWAVLAEAIASLALTNDYVHFQNLLEFVAEDLICDELDVPDDAARLVLVRGILNLVAHGWRGDDWDPEDNAKFADMLRLLGGMEHLRRAATEAVNKEERQLLAALLESMSLPEP